MSQTGTPEKKTDAMIASTNQVMAQFIQQDSDQKSLSKSSTSPINLTTSKETLAFAESPHDFNEEREMESKSKKPIYHHVTKDHINKRISFPYQAKSPISIINKINTIYCNNEKEPNPYIEINDPDSNPINTDSISTKEMNDLIDHCRKVHRQKRNRKIVDVKPDVMLDEKYKGKEITVIKKLNEELRRDDENQEQLKNFQIAEQSFQEVIKELEEYEIKMRIYYGLLQNNKTMQNDIPNTLNTISHSFDKINNEIKIITNQKNSIEVIESEEAIITTTTKTGSRPAITTTTTTITTNGNVVNTQTEKIEYITNENITCSNDEEQSEDIEKSQTSINNQKDNHSQTEKVKDKEKKAVDIQTKDEYIYENEVIETTINKKIIKSDRENQFHVNRISFDKITNDINSANNTHHLYTLQIESDKLLTKPKKLKQIHYDNSSSQLFNGPSNKEILVLKQFNSYLNNQQSFEKDKDKLDLYNTIKNQVNNVNKELENDELLMKRYYGLLKNNKTIQSDKVNELYGLDKSFDKLKNDIKYDNEPTIKETIIISKQTGKPISDIDQSSFQTIDCQLNNIQLIIQTFLKSKKSIENKDKDQGSSEIYPLNHTQLKEAQKELEDHNESAIYTITNDTPNKINAIDTSFEKLTDQMANLTRYYESHSSEIMPMYINTIANRLNKPDNISDLIKETENSFLQKIAKAALKASVLYEVIFTNKESVIDSITLNKRNSNILAFGKSLENIFKMGDIAFKLNDIVKYKKNENLRRICEDKIDLSFPLYTNGQKDIILSEKENDKKNNSSQLQFIYSKYIKFITKKKKTFTIDQEDIPMKFPQNNSSSSSLSENIYLLKYIHKQYIDYIINKNKPINQKIIKKDSESIQLKLINKSQNKQHISINSINREFDRYISSKTHAITCDQASNPIKKSLQNKQSLLTLKDIILKYQHKPNCKIFKWDDSNDRLRKFSSSIHIEEMGKKYFNAAQSQLNDQLLEITEQVKNQQANNNFVYMRIDNNSNTLIRQINTFIHNNSDSINKEREIKDGLITKEQLSSLFNPILDNEIEIAKAPEINKEAIMKQKKIEEDIRLRDLMEKRDKINSFISILIKNKRIKLIKSNYDNNDNDDEEEDDEEEDDDDNDDSFYSNRAVTRKKLKPIRKNIIKGEKGEKEEEGVVKTHIPIESLNKIARLSKVNNPKMIKFKSNNIIDDDDSIHSEMIDLNDLYSSIIEKMKKIDKSIMPPKELFTQLLQLISSFQKQKAITRYTTQSKAEQNTINKTLLSFYNLFTDILIKIKEKQKIINKQGYKCDDSIAEMNRLIPQIKKLLYKKGTYDNEKDEDSKKEDEEYNSQDKDEEENGKCIIYHSNNNNAYDSTDIASDYSHSSMSFPKNRLKFNSDYSKQKKDLYFEEEDNNDDDGNGDYISEDYRGNQYQYDSNENDNDNDIYSNNNKKDNRSLISKWATSIRNFSFSVLPLTALVSAYVKYNHH